MCAHCCDRTSGRERLRLGYQSCLEWRNVAASLVLVAATPGRPRARNAGTFESVVIIGPGSVSVRLSSLVKSAPLSSPDCQNPHPCRGPRGPQGQNDAKTQQGSQARLRFRRLASASMDIVVCLDGGGHPLESPFQGAQDRRSRPATADSSGTTAALQPSAPSLESLEALCERLEKLAEQRSASKQLVSEAKARLASERGAGTGGPQLGRLERVCEKLERMANFVPIRKGDPMLRLKVEGMNALEAMEATMKEMGYDPNAHTPLTDEEYDD